MYKTEKNRKRKLSYYVNSVLSLAYTAESNFPTKQSTFDHFLRFFLHNWIKNWWKVENCLEIYRIFMVLFIKTKILTQIRLLWFLFSLELY